MLFLDTPVISETMQPLPLGWCAGVVGQEQSGELFTTTVTVAKVQQGIELRYRPLPPRYLSPRHTADFEGCGLRLRNPWLEVRA